MVSISSRREFLQILAVGLLVLFPVDALRAAPHTDSDLSGAREGGGDGPIRKKTFIYKKVGDLEIKADVYSVGPDIARPVVFWIHGGALILGNRGGIDRALRERLVRAGYALVSIDYRLAPETKLPAILEDVGDAYRWIREQGPLLFHAIPDRIAVMGGSAGGYLTLTCGYRLDPLPACLVAFWGYGDVAGPWVSKPDPFYKKTKAVPKDEAYAAVGKIPVAEALGGRPRSRFYLYCRRQGLWSKEVAGIDPDQNPKAFDAFCPLRNVSKKYPPTLLIHGTNDTDVPYEQSELMDKELARQGVEQELITVRGAGHGLAGAAPAIVIGVNDKVLAFIRPRLRGRPAP